MLPDGFLHETGRGTTRISLQARSYTTQNRTKTSTSLRHGSLTDFESGEVCTMIDDLSKYGVRLARVLIAIVFLLNAVGIIDQTRAAHEMIARGVPPLLAPFLMCSGRALEMVAGLTLAFGFQQQLAALALAAFMVPAALVAHPFWLYYGTADLQVQLVSCCRTSRS
jgi:uncharacterized membrane protein YphA (DoxX/SURF4 family)